MSIPQQIHEIVEQMPVKKQELVLELVKTMISQDDILTEEDLADIQKARMEYSQGQAIPYNQINWN